MSDDREVSIENAKHVGGGECTPQEWITVTTQLKEAYESLVEFTTYVFERVGNN